MPDPLDILCGIELQKPLVPHLAEGLLKGPDCEVDVLYRVRGGQDEPRAGGDAFVHQSQIELAVALAIVGLRTLFRC